MSLFWAASVARGYSDLERHPDNETLPGLVIFRIEAALLYFNVDHVRRVVDERLEATADLGLVVCDLSNSPLVDVAGEADALRLVPRCRKSQCPLASCRDPRQKSRSAAGRGLEQQVGVFDRRLSIDQAISEYQNNAC